MCEQISMPDGTAISNLGELKQRFVVLREDWYDENFPDFVWPDDACLCGVDTDAVLDRAGATWDREDDCCGDPVVRSLRVGVSEDGNKT